MGNGQHRNRRGAARSRHGPHRGGAGANDRNDRRSATHLMPATPNGAPEATGAALPAGTDEPLADAGDDLDQSLDQTPEQAQAAEMAEERLERSAGELPGASPEARAETAPGVEVASSAGTPPEQPAREETAPAAPVADEAAAKAPPERRTPRGRFERFYAPGQGPRAEQNGHPHAAPGANGVNGANVVNAHQLELGLEWPYLVDALNGGCYQRSGRDVRTHRDERVALGRACLSFDIHFDSSNL